jgi:hypothetical protein
MSEIFHISMALYMSHLCMYLESLLYVDNMQMKHMERHFDAVSELVGAVVRSTLWRWCSLLLDALQSTY